MKKKKRKKSNKDYSLGKTLGLKSIKSRSKKKGIV